MTSRSCGEKVSITRLNFVTKMLGNSPIVMMNKETFNARIMNLIFKKFDCRSNIFPEVKFSRVFSLEQFMLMKMKIETIVWNIIHSNLHNHENYHDQKRTFWINWFHHKTLKQLIFVVKKFLKHFYQFTTNKISATLSFVESINQNITLCDSLPTAKSFFHTSGKS